MKLSSSGFVQHTQEGEKWCLNSELWHACAGPLVSLPAIGSRVVYFPQGKLYFIDFEYGSYSYRGHDIANHFNEYAGFDCDFSLYPDKDAQYYFFRNYLQPDKPLEVPSEELEALYIETNSFRLASHLYWALWGLIQAKMSPIDFDYLGYFFLRFSEYERQKEMCFSMARSYLSCSRVS